MVGGGASVGLVPLVKNHYREMLREHVRLKQQLVIQFQQNKKKKTTTTTSKRKTKASAATASASTSVSAQAIERVRSQGEWQDGQLFSPEVGKALRYGTKYAPTSAVRKAWVKMQECFVQGRESESKKTEEVSSGRSSQGKRAASGVFRSPYAGTDYKTMTEVDSSLLRYVLLKAVGRFCQFWSSAMMNSCEISGREIMHKAILGREEGQALITVSNHVSAIDDPFVTSLLVPEEALKPMESNRVRWVMCATDRCFKSKLSSAFFKAVQVLPVERGSGLNQTSMKVASKLMSKGGWIHVFPEGTRSTTGEMLKMKPGVGQLVVNTVKELKGGRCCGDAAMAEDTEALVASKSPVIVPYYHQGMGELMGKGMKFPSVGTDLDVLVGEPIEIGDLVESFVAGNMTEREMRRSVLTRIETALHQLKEKSENEDFQVTYNNAGRYRDATSAYRGEEPTAKGLEGVRDMWAKLAPLSAQALLEELLEESEAEESSRGSVAALAM
ncbi:tafazzin [Chloropicon primus]|uniref:Tafazzin n=2 Tax=Chloropicon primus TaxID=1764295 RepID=A0A5B8MP92_9CHLO|nr:tafazzin [Chloropicon primus]UPR01455.1 tafazzin [Chloropicon primus]|eukprot:QDZ22237.1 tafazzin [Chloropicon primus]